MGTDRDTNELASKSYLALQVLRVISVHTSLVFPNASGQFNKRSHERLNLTDEEKRKKKGVERFHINRLNMEKRRTYGMGE